MAGNMQHSKIKVCIPTTVKNHCNMPTYNLYRSEVLYGTAGTYR